MSEQFVKVRVLHAFMYEHGTRVARVGDKISLPPLDAHGVILSKRAELASEFDRDIIDQAVRAHNMRTIALEKQGAPGFGRVLQR